LFVRTLITSYVDEVADRTGDFKSLDQAKLIERNIYHTGIALQQIFDNRSNVSIDFYRVAQNIGTAHPDSKKVLLNSFSFGMFLKAPTAVGIEEALKRVGFKSFDWDKIGESLANRLSFKHKVLERPPNKSKSFWRAAKKLETISSIEVKVSSLLQRRIFDTVSARLGPLATNLRSFCVAHYQSKPADKIDRSLQSRQRQGRHRLSHVELIIHCGQNPELRPL